MSEHVNITTPLGARVQIAPAGAHLGDGVLLILFMVSVSDPRYAEVYLSKENIASLAEVLTALTGDGS